VKEIGKQNIFDLSCFPTQGGENVLVKTYLEHSMTIQRFPYFDCGTGG
jgi:hypothetical protein